jgi:hypothetical protein
LKHKFQHKEPSNFVSILPLERRVVAGCFADVSGNVAVKNKFSLKLYENLKNYKGNGFARSSKVCTFC